MTGTPTPRQHELIRDVLRDAGLEESAGLSAALGELRALVPDRAPEPRADLAALLAGGAPAALPGGVISLAERRGRKRRTAAAAGGAVIVAMTLGAGAVAASGDLRASVEQTVGVILQPATPQAAAPAVTPAPEPSPTTVPVEIFPPLVRMEPVQSVPKVSAAPAPAPAPAPEPEPAVAVPAATARTPHPGRERIQPAGDQISQGLASAPGQAKKAARDIGKAANPGRGLGRDKHNGKRP